MSEGRAMAAEQSSTAVTNAVPRWVRRHGLVPVESKMIHKAAAPMTHG